MQKSLLSSRSEVYDLQSLLFLSSNHLDVHLQQAAAYAKFALLTSAAAKRVRLLQEGPTIFREATQQKFSNAAAERHIATARKVLCECSP